MPTKIDIGVACAPNQTPKWWSRVMLCQLVADRHPDMEIGSIRTVSTAVADHSKNKTVTHSEPASEEEPRRNDLTDSNRVRATSGFLEGDAEWLWFIDDDTVPPVDALERLMKAKRDFVAGVYFLGGFPHNPIMYNRMENGLYAAFYNYVPGALFQVDSVGMGCTLIHRSVFEKIQAGHTVLERPNGSLMPVPNSIIRDGEWGLQTGDVDEGMYVKNGILHMPLRQVDEHDRRPWPFYALEYGRTEDHHFCELAANVGIRPWVDTNIQCEHIKPHPITREHNKMALAKMQAQGVFNGKN